MEAKVEELWGHIFNGFPAGHPALRPGPVVEVAAVLAEREACAALVEGLSLGRDEDVSEMRERVAAQIRARGSK
jgi:hypothetical protein